MIITQLSIKLENKPGEMSKISDLLGDEGLNVRAITASVHGKDAQVHLILDEPEKALEMLRGRGYEVDEHKVLAVETPDHPGGLNAILRPLADAGINVEYLYPLIGKFRGNAIMIVGGNPIEEAAAALKKSYINILDEELYAL